MRDLIDRQDAVDAIWSHATKILENSDYDLFIQDIYKMVCRHIAELIEQLPPAQPEIIRCGECLMHGVCRFEQGLGENGFCSQGKKGDKDE